MKKLTFIALASVSGFSFVPMAQAAVTCTLNPERPAINTIVALQGGSITVGEDIPNGTAIFRQYFKVGNRPEFNCSSTTIPWVYQDTLRYAINPKPLSAWNSGNWAGKVYQTGVYGIGIVAWYAGNSLPYSKPLNTTSNAGFNIGALPEFDISLIKIGTITPGTIRGVDLPTIIDEFMFDRTNFIRASTVSFSGALNIVSQTCTTPNPMVQLGKYDISSVFKGLYSVTGWADASIILTNCPRFYGTMDSGQTNYGSDSPTDRGQAGTPQNNELGVILRPNTAILDAAKGIIGLRAEPNVATGVGIQLATAISGANVTAAEFNIEKRYTMRNSSDTTYKIPLNARYIQTNAKVTPGPANATLTYTINYY
jgi:type 1 fimbria pilin